MRRIIASAITVLSSVTLVALTTVFAVDRADSSRLAPAAPTPSQEERETSERGSQRRCSNATLRGSYGFTAQGVTLPGSPVPSALQGPFASGGSATFDGHGNLQLTATSSFNGVIQGPTTVRGVYLPRAGNTPPTAARLGSRDERRVSRYPALRCTSAMFR